MYDSASPNVIDLASLRSALAEGWRPSYLFFWGHRSRTNLPGKHILSQWWPAAFIIDGERFPTVEHFMMAEKARLFGDAETRAQIMAISDPAQAKAHGRAVRGFDEQIWQAHRFEIVVRGNAAKFEQNPTLMQWLRNTSEDVIVEASPVDRIWGIGLKADDPRAGDPMAWQGLNLLGFSLMRVRLSLREVLAR
jgi:ribA/ribD-fused uncharacterized protein